VQDLDEARSRKNQDYKASVSQPLHSLTKAKLHPVLPNPRQIIRVRLLTEAFPNPILKQNVINVSYGYIAAKCASPYKITLIDREGYPESEGDVYINQVDGDEEDFDENIQETTLNCLQFRESTRLSVTRCILAQSKVSDHWRHTNIFHTFTKIRKRNCKVIMDSENCINVVSSMIINKVGLKAEHYPHPYKVSWINEVALNVTQRCLVPI